MVKWYVMRIKSEKMTLEDVPKKWHDAVEKTLSEDEKIDTK